MKEQLKLNGRPVRIVEFDGNFSIEVLRIRYIFPNVWWPIDRSGNKLTEHMIPMGAFKDRQSALDKIESINKGTTIHEL